MVEATEMTDILSLTLHSWQDLGTLRYLGRTPHSPLFLPLNPGQDLRFTRPGVPNLRDLMPDDLRCRWCNSNRVHNKCNAFGSSWNHLPSPTHNPWKNSLAKPFPGAKNVEDHCTQPSPASPADDRRFPSRSFTACRPVFAVLDFSASRAQGPGASMTVLLKAVCYGGWGGQKFRSRSKSARSNRFRA